MKNSVLQLTFFSTLLFFLHACSTSKAPHYNSKNKNWETRQIDPAESVDHTVYLIGETGSSKTPSAALQLLQKQALQESTKSSIVFLGNQVYPDGVPDSEEAGYQEAVASLTRQFSPFKNYNGNLFVLPGNKDWHEHHEGEDGLEGVKRQEEIIEALFDNKNVFLPDNGCGDPVEVDLGDELVMIVLNSEWWLQQDDERGGNIGCEVDDEIEFLEKLEDIITDNKGKNILITLHHPIYSSGKSGGYYPLKDHIFPFKKDGKNVYFPLPVIGSLYPISKKIMGSRQDLSHPRQAALKKSLTKLCNNYEDVVIVSGHEPGMQYFYKKFHHFIVSGGGGREDYIKRGNSAEFSYQKGGFVKLKYLDNHEVWMEFWTTEAGGKLVFRKKLHNKPPEIFKEKDYQSIQKNNAKSITTKATTIYDAKKFKRMWFGDHFRNEWGTDVVAPVVFLDTLKGGLTPIKKGGGFQTKSLRLEAANGKQYTLRTINKDVSKVVPPILRGTFTQSIMQDGISASHPYGAFVVPDLADAVGIYHTKPSLVYVPPQAALGKFNDDFGDKLFLFEERPSGDWSDNPDFGNSKKIIGAEDLIKKLKKNHKSVVDQDFVLRSRLFDIVVGDWDRHDDQWRWASAKEGGKTVYRPIPRDRDQVFYRFDGILPFIVGRPFITPQFRSFDKEIDYLPGLVFNARSFDRANLNKKTKAEFIEMAKEVQANLTDEVIDNAFKAWQADIFKLNGEDIIAKLKTRRNNLVAIAEEYYKWLAQEPDVTGTKAPELFEITRINDQATQVQVYDLSDGGKELVYDRTFDNRDTKEIRLFGRKGEDIFKVNGDVDKGIKLLIIGGGGADKIEELSSVKGGKKMTTIYDKPDGLTIVEDKGEIDNQTADEKGINNYDRFGYLYDKKIGFPLIASNPDAGIGIGYFTIIQKQGFRTSPYQSQHTINGAFSFGTSAVSLGYRGHFPKGLGKNDFVLEARGTGPTFVTNYFGLGNTIPDTDQDLEFHRVRGYNIKIHPALFKSYGGGHSIQIGPTYEFFNIERTEDRFVNTAESNLGITDFESNNYIGLDANYDFSVLDNALIPLRGYHFQLGTEYRYNVDNSDNNFVRFHSNLAFYIPFNIRKSIVLATQVGGAYNAGDYQFFQANQLGGSSRLRGFNTGKFSGDGIFYHTTDLRVALGRSKSTTFPFTFGAHFSFDHGRTWLAGEENDDIWHTSQGAGIFFMPLNLFVFRISYFTSDDDSILSIGANFSF